MSDKLKNETVENANRAADSLHKSHDWGTLILHAELIALFDRKVPTRKDVPNCADDDKRLTDLVKKHSLAYLSFKQHVWKVLKESHKKQTYSVQGTGYYILESKDQAKFNLEMAQKEGNKALSKGQYNLDHVEWTNLNADEIKEVGTTKGLLSSAQTTLNAILDIAKIEESKRTSIFELLKRKAKIEVGKENASNE